MFTPYKLKGFTLIEMIVTVAIVAILASIAIPAYNGYIISSRNTEGANDLAALKLAQEEFFLENNTYFGPINGADNIVNGIQGLWRPGNWDLALSDAANVAALNFTYVIAVGSTAAITTSFSATATGQNDVDNTVVLTMTN